MALFASFKYKVDNKKLARVRYFIEARKAGTVLSEEEEAERTALVHELYGKEDPGGYVPVTAGADGAEMNADTPRRASAKRRARSSRRRASLPQRRAPLPKRRRTRRNDGKGGLEKKGGMTVIRMPEGRPFRILQLTDIHIGGGLLSRKKDRLALDAVRKIVRASHADLVVVTGDMVYPLFMYSGTSNNLKASKKFGECMDSLGVPWTFTFGNHDEECIAFYKKERLADYYMTLKSCCLKRATPLSRVWATMRCALRPQTASPS